MQLSIQVQPPEGKRDPSPICAIDSSFPATHLAILPLNRSRAGGFADDEFGGHDDF